MSTGGAPLEMLNKAVDEWAPVGGGTEGGSVDVRVELTPGDGELYRWIAR